MNKGSLSRIVWVALMGFLIGAVAVRADPPVPPTGDFMHVALQRGSFTVFRYPSKKAQTLAIILFGSGDCGWTYWEERACHALARAGYDVIGIDSEAYANSDYTLDILQSDFRKIATAAEQFHANHPLPIIVGGYSMGAEQAVAVAGGPNRPPGLAGLLLVSPGARGRYGLRASDQWGVTPTGPGTFALSDFASKLSGLRIIQWHGGYDPLDSRNWLTSLAAAHKEFDYDAGWHNYKSACDEFLVLLSGSASWITGADSSPTESHPYAVLDKEHATRS